MSGLRAALPRVCRVFATRGPPAHRHFHRHRLVPIRSVFDEFFIHGPRTWPFRMMEDHMRNMERMVDSVMPRNNPENFTRVTRDIQVRHTDTEFEVRLETDGYQPENLKVKVTGEGKVTGHHLSISGEMKETDQHGTVSARFHRRITIPQDVDIETLESLFTEEGHLVVRGRVTGHDVTPGRTLHIRREATETPGGEERGAKTPGGDALGGETPSGEKKHSVEAETSSGTQKKE